MRKNITKCTLFSHFLPQGSCGADILERAIKRGNPGDMQKSPWLFEKNRKILGACVSKVLGLYLVSFDQGGI